jgi:hypothetical protein
VNLKGPFDNVENCKARIEIRFRIYVTWLSPLPGARERAGARARRQPQRLRGQGRPHGRQAAGGEMRRNEKLRIVTLGIRVGDHSPFRDARRFPSTRW